MVIFCKSNFIHHFDRLKQLYLLYSEIIEILPIIHRRYVIETAQNTRFPFSKYQHDAGEFCSDLLHLLSEESEIVSDFFSLTLTEVNGICHK